MKTNNVCCFFGWFGLIWFGLVCWLVGLVGWLVGWWWVASKSTNGHHSKEMDEIGFSDRGKGATVATESFLNVEFRLNETGIDVSENRGFSPQIIHFSRVFHYKPSILGIPLFLETPVCYMYSN